MFVNISGLSYYEMKILYRDRNTYVKTNSEEKLFCVSWVYVNDKTIYLSCMFFLILERMNLHDENYFSFTSL
jgi:hypothetical protein